MDSRVVKALMLFITISLIQLVASRNMTDMSKELDRQLISLPQKPIQKGGKLMLGTFKWNSCKKDAPLVLNSLTISPDPIKVPGNITVSFDGTANVEMEDGLNGKVVMKKKTVLGTWIKIPCVDEIGSCTYKDLCSMLPAPTDPCPDTLPKCSCPFPKGNYVIPSTRLELSDIPSFLSNSDYKVRINLYDKGGKNLACYDIQFEFKSA